ncbi:MAG: hypothetical protein KatS3mg027_1706 [Bacteroidia bacterium]|nr:MAG: hypothetical protein KatS3mg027_1706 [Bacteroidia bacterium]
MISGATLQEILNPFLESKKLFIIDIHISPYNEIEIIIDGEDYVSIEKCTEVSRYVESQLNRDIEDYALIVGSPDATQPLKIPRQYPKHVGKELVVLTNENKEIKGKLIAADSEKIVLLVQRKNKENNKKKLIEEEIEIPFSTIKKGKVKLPF